jgi:ketosteroid isomerase-like protein
MRVLPWIAMAVAMVLSTPGLSPASAAVTESAARQAAETISTQVEAAYNRHDAAAIGALYTPDGTLLPARPSPSLGAVITGPPAIERFFADAFKTFTAASHKLVEAHPVGESAVFMIAELHLTGQGEQGPLRLDGHFGSVLERSGVTWKIRMTVTNGSAAPAPAQTSGGFKR